jgi:nitroreductase
MNPNLDFIFKRRSVRKYVDREIPEEKLHDLLEAAMAAPSARATDPWHFVVITKRETLNRMTSALPNGKMLLTAPAAILV